MASEHESSVSYYKLTTGDNATGSCNSPFLRVAQSRIPNAGSGLFTIEALRKDTHVAIYTGRIYSLSELQQWVSDRRYVMKIGINLYVDAKYTPWVLARYINDPRDSSRVNVMVTKDVSAKQATLKTIRNVQAGEELYIDYGIWYWLAYNMIYTPVKKKH